MLKRYMTHFLPMTLLVFLFALQGIYAAQPSRKAKPRQEREGKVTIAKNSPGLHGPREQEVATPVSLDIDLRLLPQIGPAVKNMVHPELNPFEEILRERIARNPNLLDPVLQDWTAPNMPTPNANFAGLDFNSFGAGWPPDTNGDVGPNHYIQTVNTSIGIFNKTGTLLAGLSFDSFFATAAAPCNNSNNGDPIALYDPKLDRWLVADFAWTSTQNGPYFMCIAYSKTSDPVSGGWWLYTYRADDAAHPWLNDYPKLAAWRDAIYMSSNMFDCLNSTCSSATFEGVRAFALNRDDLSTGAPLRSVVFDLGSNTASMLPSNYRGTQPPAGEPDFFVSLDPFGASQLDLYKFHVDWVTPANSTFTGPTNLNTSAFNAFLSSVPENGGEALDSLGDRAMFQLQYRTISGTESLWISHSVLSGGVSGIRWYEIRNPNGAATINQQGTFQPSDNLYRWMPSLAVDKNGNMAVGYSVSSASIKPEIRYAGRLATDPSGLLSQGEATLIAGAGAQNGGFNRWGDYSAMTVDPSDDCTFWYTTEYYAANGNNWQTRIGSFAFPQCTGGGGGGGNLLINGDMEADTDADQIPDAWKEKGTVAGDMLTAGTGVGATNAYRFQGTKSGKRKLLQEIAGGVAGDLFQFTGRVDRTLAPSSAKVEVFIKIFTVGKATKIKIDIPDGTDFNTLIDSGVFSAPRNYSKLRVYLRVSMSSGVSPTVYFDDLTLVHP